MVDMTVTRTTSLPGIFDTDVDGQIDPGETFLTTIEITNITAGTLTGLDISDAFMGSTVNSVRITPIAADEAFNITGNTPVVYSFAQLLANDVDPDGSHASLTISGIAGQVNGTAVIDNMAQTVTFTPDTGLDIGQTASFTYTITDAQGLTNVAGSGGVVGLTITDVVWYVDSAASAAGADGSYLHPFTTLADVSNGGDPDGANETIFVYNNAAYTGGIVLETGQKLFGDSHAFSANGITIGGTLRTGGSDVLTNSVINHDGVGITLGSGNTIDGFTLTGNLPAAVGIKDGGANIGTTSITNTQIGGAGQIIDINQGGALTATLSSATSTGFATAGQGGAIDLANASLTGTFTVTGGTTINGTQASGGVNIASTGLTANLQGGTTVNTGATDAITIGSGIVAVSGGLNVDTTSGRGLVTTGGTLGVAAGTNTIDTGTGQIAVMSGTIVAAGGVSFTSLTSGITTGNAIQLTNVDGGTFAGGNVTIAGTTNNGISVGLGSAATFTFGTTQIGTGVNAVGQNGVLLDSANGSVTFGSLTVGNNSGSALNIQNATNAVTVNGGALGSTGGNDAVQIVNGTGAVTVAATVTKTTAGNVVDISGHSTGAINFTGDISATGGLANGINLTNNTGGNINFSGASVTLTTGTNTALNFTNTAGTGANVSISGGDFDVSTTTGTGINATSTTIGAGSLTISGGGNEVVATTGRAVNISGVNENITLHHVNASGGATTAIFITNAGNAVGNQFIITGTGTSAGTGGVINAITGTDGQTGSGIGVYINNSSNISLSNMNFTGAFDNFGIRGDAVTNFTLRDSNFTGTYGTNVSFDEAAIRFGSTASGTNGLLGTSALLGNNIAGGREDNVAIYNEAAGTLNLTVADSAANAAIFGANHLTDGNDGLHIETLAGTLNLTVDGVAFNAARGDMLQTIVGNSASQNLTITNNAFHNMHGDITAAGGGIYLGGSGATSNYNVTYNLSGNTFKGAEGDAVHIEYNGQSGNISGVIQNNVIGTPGTGGAGQSAQAFTGSSAGGAGIRVILEKFGGSGTLNHAVRIEGNQISDVIDGDGGLSMRSNAQPGGGTARLEATITNNIINQMGTPSSMAARFLVGGSNSSGDFALFGLNINGNTFDDTHATDNLSNAVQFDQASSDAHFYLPGYTGSNNGELIVPGPTGTASTALQAFLTSHGNTMINGSGLKQSPGTTVDATAVRNIINTSPQYNFVLPVPLLAEPSGFTTWEEQRDAELASNPVTPEEEGGDQLGADGGTEDPEDAPGGAGSGSSGGDGGSPDVLAPPSNAGTLDQPTLDLLVEAAIQRWADAGATAEQLAAMRGVSISIADMTGIYVGSSAPGAILIDSDGAGHGWFLDATPGDDSEFAGTGGDLTATAEGGAAGKVDLLTVLMHELGHQIGLSDDYGAEDKDDLMYGYVREGDRRLPSAEDVAGAGGPAVADHGYAIGPVNVSPFNLPANKTVQVLVESTLDPFAPGLAPSFTNTTTVTYNGALTETSNTETLSNSSPLALDTLSLGNLVFRDNNGNGLFDAGDVGVDGVRVRLYLDSDGNNVADGAEIAFVDTAGGGLFTFVNLAPGNYMLGIAATHFGAGQPLDGLIMTTAVANPNTDIDNDSNAVGSVVTGVFSNFVTLAYNSEPITDGDADADTNFSVDLGFTPNQPPVIGAGTLTGSATERPDGDPNENQAPDHNATGSIAFDDADEDDTHTVSATPGGGGYLGTFTPTIATAATGPAAGTIDWTYSVADAALEGLRGGQSVVQTYVVTVDDGDGGTDSETVTITLNGANDAVLLDPIPTLTITDTAANDALPPVTGMFTVTDPDIGDTTAFAVTGSIADVSEAGYDRSVSSAYGTLFFNQASGAYRFVIDNAAVQSRVADDALAFSVSVTDGGGATSSGTFNVTIDGVNDTPDVAAAGPFPVNDTPTNDTFADIVGTLSATDRDAGDSVTFGISGGVATGLAGYTVEQVSAYGTLYVDGASGNYRFVANNAAIQALKIVDFVSFQLTGTDTNGGVGAQTLTINVSGVNDTPEMTAIMSASYVDTSVDDGFSAYNGTLASSDRDNPETLTYSVAGQAADNSVSGFDVSTTGARGTLYLNTATGAYRFAPNDAAIELLKTNVNDSFAFTVTDGSAVTDSENLVVAFTGANDRPDVAALAGDSAAETLTETNASLSTNGTLTATDRDADPLLATLSSFSKSGTTTGLGSSDVALQAMFLGPILPFSGGPNSFGWSFNSGAENFDYLAQGESLILTYSVQVGDGVLLSTPQDVVITITGANDAPVMAAIPPQNYADTAADDTFAQFTGTLSFTDSDASDTHVFSISGEIADNSQAGYDRSSVSSYGTLYLNSTSGAYLFIPNDAGIEALKAGLTAFYALTVTDSAGGSDFENLAIQITATNDNPELAAIPDATITDTANDDTFAPIDGNFMASDRDNPETLTYSVVASVGDLSQAGFDRSVTTGQGVLYFNSGTGAYRFLADDAAIESMKGDFGLVFGVGVTDGSAATASGTFTINLDGTNDTPDASIGAGDSGGATLTETNAGLNANGTISVADRDVPETVTATVLTVVKTGTVTGLVPSDSALMAMFSGPAGPVPAGPGSTNNVAWGFNSGGEAFNYLDDGESLTLTYGIQVTDSSGATDVQNVTITIDGTNDGPVLSVGGGDSTGASLNETNGGLVQSGSLTIVDPDQSDAVTPSVIAFAKSGVTAGVVPSDAQLQAMLQLPGLLTADPGSTSNLTWTFNSGSEAFNYLHTGETLTLTYTVRGTDDSGIHTATQNITINVIGSNDPPVIIAPTDAFGMVTELPDHDPNENVAILTDAGTIYFADNEIADTHTASFAPQAGGYVGAFTLGAVDQVGRTVGWNFSVSDAVLNSLGAGVVVTQYYTVTIDDGEAAGTVDQVVEIVMVGINDAAILTSANVFVEQGPAVATASGDLDITDEDNPAFFLTQSGSQGFWGDFSIDANGQWSYVADQVYVLAAGEFRTDVFTVLAVDGTPTTVAVTITGHDAPAMAQQDLFTTTESALLGAGLNLFADNGSGADTDPDTPLQVGAVNAVAGNVGHSLLLASGARVFVNANGTFSYDPNHAFDGLTAAVGAANQFGHDSFTYTLAGGSTAMVFVTLSGEESPGDLIYGDGAANAIIGLSGNDTFLLQQAGDDNVWGMTGNDGFYFGAAYGSGDNVDGGDGTDTIALQGNVATWLGDTDNVEVILAMSGSDDRFGDTADNRYDYDLTTTDGNVAAGNTLTVQATGLLAGEDLHFDGSAETNGHFRIFAGQGDDDLIGGAGNDGFFFGADGNLTGDDRVVGGAGIDSIALRGNYGSPLVLQDATFSGIEVLAILSGHTNEFGGVIVPAGFDYSLQLADGNVAAGQRLDVNAARLGADERLSFNAIGESDGSFRILSGAGDDSLFTGAGDDVIYGGLGRDAMGGGAGADTFVYRSAAESTSVNHDAINGFDWNEDRIDAPGGVRGFTRVATGELSTATFDDNLAAALDGVLGAGEAALFLADSGDQNGNIFAVIDTNGVAGYQAGQDLVIWLVNPVLPIDPNAGVIV